MQYVQHDPFHVVSICSHFEKSYSKFDRNESALSEWTRNVSPNQLLWLIRSTSVRNTSSQYLHFNEWSFDVCSFSFDLFGKTLSHKPQFD